MTKHNIEGGADKFSPLLLTCQPLPYVMFCHLPDSGRHMTSIFQGRSLSLSLSLSRSRGREGIDPGNEVAPIPQKSSEKYCYNNNYGDLFFWQRWYFSTSFLSVDQWVHSDSPFMAAHLEKCKYFDHCVPLRQFSYCFLVPPDGNKAAGSCSGSL